MIEIEVDIRKTLVDRGRRFSLETRFSTAEDFVVLFGPSGSGKSLTLQAIAGLLRPDAGRIRIGDRVLFDGKRDIDVPVRERRIGYLFQDYALFPHLTVSENVGAGLRRLGQWRLPWELQKRVDEMIEVFELKELAEALPRDLSGGQRQGAALARALARAPDLLLLDEPFAALNPLLRAKMRQELARIQSRFAVPVLLITHDEADVREFGDTLLLYEAGRVSSAWPFKKLLAQPAAADAGLGEGSPRSARPISRPPSPEAAGMKIAIATKDFATVSGHAGQARQWLLYDCRPGESVPAPRRVELEKAQVLHHHDDSEPHPLDGIDIVVAASAGDGFLRHVAKRGAQVLLTGESDPDTALRKLIAGTALPDPRFDPSLLLCKLKDFFTSRY